MALLLTVHVVVTVALLLVFGLVVCAQWVFRCPPAAVAAQWLLRRPPAVVVDVLRAPVARAEAAAEAA